MRVTGTVLECFAANQRVAGHAVSAVRGGYTTTAEHMPASHRAHLEWTPAKLIAWGQRIGVSTAAVVTWQLEHRPHPEQGYRACLGLLALARRYTAAAAGGGLRAGVGDPRAHLRSVASILVRPGPPACAVHRRGRRRHRARQRARARLLPLTDPQPTKENPMLNEHTLDQLRSLRLDGMVRAIEDQATSTAATALAFEERLGLLVEREVAWRDNRRVARLLKAAS